MEVSWGRSVEVRGGRDGGGGVTETELVARTSMVEGTVKEGEEGEGEGVRTISTAVVSTNDASVAGTSKSGVCVSISNPGVCVSNSWSTISMPVSAVGISGMAGVGEGRGRVRGELDGEGCGRVRGEVEGEGDDEVRGSCELLSGSETGTTLEGGCESDRELVSLLIPAVTCGEAGVGVMAVDKTGRTKLASSKKLEGVGLVGVAWRDTTDTPVLLETGVEPLPSTTPSLDRVAPSRVEVEGTLEPRDTPVLDTEMPPLLKAGSWLDELAPP